jgi:hypothetical protein
MPQCNFVFIVVIDLSLPVNSLVARSRIGSFHSKCLCASRMAVINFGAKRSFSVFEKVMSTHKPRPLEVS